MAPTACGPSLTAPRSEPPWGRATRIDVSLAVDRDSGLRLVVADDGPGFSPELLPVASDRFTRADAARGRTTGGAGLSLAIVAGLAAAHGGDVAASNGPPLGGAVVAVNLPVT